MKQRYAVWRVSDHYNISDNVEMVDFVLPCDTTKAKATKVCKLLNEIWEAGKPTPAKKAFMIV